MALAISVITDAASTKQKHWTESGFHSLVLSIFIDYLFLWYFYIELIHKHDKIEKKINEIVFEFTVNACTYM